MPVSLVLQRRGAYTNLDYVEGDVKLDLSSSENIENVVVKVEGISKTTVYAPKHPDRPGRRGDARSKNRPIVEVHKVLYLQQVVWPDEKLRQTRTQNSSSTSWTLQAGSYTFPFKLRIPVNNACQPPPGPLSMQNYHFTHNSVTTVSTPQGHVKQTLPPSLGGLEDAFIRYFVKVTVNRPSFFSRNHRFIVPFVFCPIEPPRPPPQNSQIFVRKKHTLAAPPRGQDSSLFSLFARKSGPGNAGTIAFEVRLPNPAILVPTEPIPLTLLVKREMGSQGTVYIRSVQVMLGITTFIAAQGYRRELGYLQPILTATNLNIMLPANQPELSINPADFLQQSSSSTPKNAGIALPDTVPPSFRTCNIARKYTLVFQLGVSSSPSLQPELIQLTVDVQVFSGFKPPPELLSTARNAPPPAQPVAEKGDAAMAVQMGSAELPTYDEAIASGLSGAGGDVRGRGNFEVEEQYLQGADNWDVEEKR